MSFSSGVNPGGDLRVDSLQRPITTDARHFWYCSQEQWNVWVSKAATDVRDNALQNLRSYDYARRAMETPEGILANPMCGECAQRGASCRFIVDDPSKRCAYCRCKNKSRCTARNPSIADSPVPALTERLNASNALIDNLQRQLAYARARISQLEEQNEQLQLSIEALQPPILDLQDIVSNIRGVSSLFPDDW